MERSKSKEKEKRAEYVFLVRKMEKKVKLSLIEELQFISGFQLLGPLVAWFRLLFAAIRTPPVKGISRGRRGYNFMQCWFLWFAL